MKTADAQFYWANHPVTADRIATYKDSIHDPHRQWVVDALRSLDVRGTVLEVGCHCGPLLHVMEQAGFSAVGLDINAHAIDDATDAGLTAAVGAIPSTLERFPTGAFDAVVSSYCLAYISPKDLSVTLADMVRLSRKGVVIVEPMAGAGVAEEMYGDDVYVEWRHDYLVALTAAQALIPNGPVIEMTRTRKDRLGAINGVVVGVLTWPN